MTHHVDRDDRVDAATGAATVYDRFGGRAVAWRDGAGTRDVLADHLGSSQGEVQGQAELSQRRTYPVGGDRAVPGAADPSKPERFTGQWRLDAGGGNAARELYRFGDQGAPSLGGDAFAEPLLSAGRSYLPGVALFVQPDGLVKSLANPQTLNRYAYGLNNPVRYVDPTGHATAPPGPPLPTTIRDEFPAVPRGPIIDVPIEHPVSNTAVFLGAGAERTGPIIDFEPTRRSPLDGTIRDDFGDRQRGPTIYTADTTNSPRGPYTGAPTARDSNLGKTIDPLTGWPVGQFAADPTGNVMIQPKGGDTVPAGKNGVDTHARYPNNSNYQRLNPEGHGTNPTPHGHGHLEGTGPDVKGQGPSIDTSGQVVPSTSPDAHWPIND